MEDFSAAASAAGVPEMTPTGADCSAVVGGVCSSVCRGGNGRGGESVAAEDAGGSWDTSS